MINKKKYRNRTRLRIKIMIKRIIQECNPWDHLAFIIEMKIRLVKNKRLTNNPLTKKQTSK